MGYAKVITELALGFYIGKRGRCTHSQVGIWPQLSGHSSCQLEILLIIKYEHNFTLEKFSGATMRGLVQYLFEYTRRLIYPTAELSGCKKQEQIHPKHAPPWGNERLKNDKLPR